MIEITDERFLFFTLCEKELSHLRDIKGICPNCRKGLIMLGYKCNNCGFCPENN